jgi:glycosyltransferase involved in cell wall biosynthesis
MPKVSIIMGVYNVKNREMAKIAIDSILNQTFEDFEFIICDDGSTNDTRVILNELTKGDRRVRIIENESNKGLAFSLNHCLENATGEYIARMDIDDISALDRLKKQIYFLEHNSEYALVGSNAGLFTDDVTWGIRKFKEKPNKRDFLFGSQILHASMLIRREVLKELSGYRVSWETTRAEDYDLFMRLYAKGYITYSIQEVLYKIREDNDAYARRKYKYRLQEAVVRYKGFKVLHLMPIGYIYILKPLIVGLIPQKILKKMRKENLNSNN